MAQASPAKKLFVNGTVHPAKINDKDKIPLETLKPKQDNISLVSVSTVASSIKIPRSHSSTSKEVKLDVKDLNHLHPNINSSSAPSVVVNDISGDESDFSELQSRRGSSNQVSNAEKLSKIFNPKNTAAQKWVKAGKQVRRAVAVTQALQRPQSREEKVRKQLYGSKAVLPVVPVPVAVILLILNILIPGLGTIVGGCTFCCCATTYDKPNRKGIGQKIPKLVCRNLLVGFAQLFTVSFLLIGWVWSISWGMTMLYMAIERDREKKEGSDWFPDEID
ncbi:uncharacterized protein LOC120336262 [Styela clava]|uniref:uncharacterized protein LOC120336262 n=1 Tax=Styela clava TaxID=7725 RepID=UPI00193962BE|nr:uncharacterized protein LOC120336262 [Styela clava]